MLRAGLETLLNDAVLHFEANLTHRMGRDGRRGAWERPMVVRWLVVVVLVVLGGVVGGAPLPPPPPGVIAGIAAPEGYGECSPVP